MLGPQKRTPVSLADESRRRSVCRRLFIGGRFLVVLTVASLFAPPSSPVAAQDPTGAAPRTAGDPPAAGPAPATAPTTAPAAANDPNAISPDVVAALRGLNVKTSSSRTRDTERKKLYEILSEKGDARIIPALNAFLAGELQLRDDQLALYGETRLQTVNGKELKLRALYDAVTMEAIRDEQGNPILEEVNLSNAFTKPLTVPARVPVLDLIAMLSLLHPDPEQRIASIRGAGERAVRVFPSPDDEDRVKAAMAAFVEQVTSTPGTGAATQPATRPPVGDEKVNVLLAAIKSALEEKPAAVLDPAPSESSIGKVTSALSDLATTRKAGDDPTTLPVELKKQAENRERLAKELKLYADSLAALKKNMDDLSQYATAFERQLSKEAGGPFTDVLTEAKSLTDVALGDRTVSPSDPDKVAKDTAVRVAAATRLGEFGTFRAENALRKLYSAAERSGNEELRSAVAPALEKAASYQQKVRFVQYTFAGLSSGSIYVLLALGLAITFGLMGVINMAHGEFMMIGAFTTYAVSLWFKSSFPQHYDWFPAVAIPAAFLVAAFVGLLTETLIIKHLYGRTIDSLIATIGLSLILIQVARGIYGDSVSVSPPTWMQGSKEVMADVQFNRARAWAIVYCGLTVLIVYLIINKTKLGLLLRATTQNRQMAAALGVPTRRVDALTFAFGAGLAGLPGVVVPMIDKINPSIGQDYIVSSFMVVVVGGVGKVAGAIIAGFGLGAIGNYLEPLLGSIKTFASTSSVFSKVIVLALVVMFLQWRPSGLFPPRGRLADA